MPILGFPGHPWSRGKVEVVQKLIDTCLLKLSGFVRNEDDRMEWRRAYRESTISLEDLESVIREHVKNWNTQAAEGQQSRVQLSEKRSDLLLPAPPQDRLAHFALAGNWGDVEIQDTGLPLPNERYFPPMRTEQDFHRYMSKVGKRARYIVIPQLSSTPWSLRASMASPGSLLFLPSRSGQAAAGAPSISGVRSTWSSGTCASLQRSSVTFVNGFTAGCPGWRQAQTS